MLNQTIKSEIDKLWDKFWSGGISNPLMAVEQISYLLFMRRLDEIDRKRVEDADGLDFQTLLQATFLRKINSPFGW